jgi:hypothetical protein
MTIESPLARDLAARLAAEHDAPVLAAALLSALRAAVARAPQDPRVMSALGHAGAAVTLLDGALIDPVPPHPHMPADAPPEAPR